MKWHRQLKFSSILKVCFIRRFDFMDLLHLRYLCTLVLNCMASSDWSRFFVLRLSQKSCRVCRWVSKSLYLTSSHISSKSMAVCHSRGLNTVQQHANPCAEQAGTFSKSSDCKTRPYAICCRFNQIYLTFIIGWR